MHCITLSLRTTPVQLQCATTPAHFTLLESQARREVGKGRIQVHTRMRQRARRTPRQLSRPPMQPTAGPCLLSAWHRTFTVPFGRHALEQDRCAVAASPQHPLHSILAQLPAMPSAACLVPPEPSSASGTTRPAAAQSEADWLFFLQYWTTASRGSDKGKEEAF